MKHAWTDEEDNQLKELVKQYGRQWAFISSKMANRNPSQIASRWEKCLDPRLKKGNFTKEEDEIIIKFVNENGAKKWPMINQLLPNRSAKQCRERWFNHLDPNINKNNWTYDEDRIIFYQHSLRGPKWSIISHFLVGRTDNAVKNRWNSSISKRIKCDLSGHPILLPEQTRKLNSENFILNSRSLQLPPQFIPNAKPVKHALLTPLNTSIHCKVNPNPQPPLLKINEQHPEKNQLPSPKFTLPPISETSMSVSDGIFKESPRFHDETDFFQFSGMNSGLNSAVGKTDPFSPLGNLTPFTVTDPKW